MFWLSRARRRYSLICHCTPTTQRWKSSGLLVTLVFGCNSDHKPNTVNGDRGMWKWPIRLKPCCTVLALFRNPVAMVLKLMYGLPVAVDGALPENRLPVLNALRPKSYSKINPQFSAV